MSGMRGFEHSAGPHLHGLALDQRVCCGLLVIEGDFRLVDLGGGS